MAKEKKQTKEEVLEVIKEKRYQLDFDIDIPDEFKGDTAIIETILEHGSIDFAKLPDNTKNNKDILKLIISESAWEFKNFPDFARDDEEISISAIKSDSGCIQYVSERLKADKEIVKLALSSDGGGWNLQYITSKELLNDKELLKIAISTHDCAFGYVPEELQKDEELIKEAIKGKINSFSFELFPEKYKDNEALALKAVSDDAGCLQYLSDRLKDNEEVVLIAVKKRGMYLEYASKRLRDKKEVVLTALQEGGDTSRVNRYMSERFKKDKQIAIATIEYDSRYLDGLDLEVFNDREVIDACLKERQYFYGTSYKYFPLKFKEDRSITLSMAKGMDFPLNEVPKKFKNDEEIVLNAIKDGATNFEFIGTELIKNLEFLKKLYKNEPSILSYMNDELKNQLFTTRIVSSAHYSKELIMELVIDSGSVDNKKREAKNFQVKKEKEVILKVNDFPILTYEDDGPVGSYLSVRLMNHIVLSGEFVFYVSRNSGEETYTSHTQENNYYRSDPVENDNFLKHKVYLINTSNTKILEINHQDIENHSKMLYFGRADNILKGVQLFQNDNDYREAQTILNQEEVFRPVYEKVSDDTLRVINNEVEEVNGASRVFVDGFGWRWLIPNEDGSFAALDILKNTTDIDDWNWLKEHVKDATKFQKELIIRHFETSNIKNEVTTIFQ